MPLSKRPVHLRVRFTQPVARAGVIAAVCLCSGVYLGRLSRTSLKSNQSYTHAAAWTPTHASSTLSPTVGVAADSTPEVAPRQHRMPSLVPEFTVPSKPLPAFPVIWVAIPV
jgi:hypothetical protein